MSQSVPFRPRMRKVMEGLSRLVARLAAWYWRDPIAAERRRVEVDAMRLGGRVFWND